MAIDLYRELEAVLSALARADVEYALVGGLAVAIYGVPRATKDIDLLVRPEHLDQALRALRAIGYDLRARPMRFSDGMCLERVTRIDGATSMTVDFILVDENHAPIFETRREVSVDFGTVWTISRESLIAMKTSAGRARDLADVEQLMELDR